MNTILFSCISVAFNILCLCKIFKLEDDVAEITQRTLENDYKNLKEKFEDED